MNEHFWCRRFALIEYVFFCLHHLFSITAAFYKHKPNGQFHLPFESQAIVSFMRELSIRKLPGVGKVNERLLESIGINVSTPYPSPLALFIPTNQ